MYTGLQDIFKIGIGPSSSHTVGPMRAARRFLLELPEGALANVVRVRVTLYGSLAHTGRGHGTDTAVLLGLMGQVPDEVDCDAIPEMLADIRSSHQLALMGSHAVAFDESTDLIFNYQDLLPLHSNGMLFEAFGANDAKLAERTLYSIGGGFVVDEEEHFVGSPKFTDEKIPYPFDNMQQLLDLASKNQRSICELLLDNEASLHGLEETRTFIRRVLDTMMNCIQRGMVAEGLLPGVLKMPRRARLMAERLRNQPLAGGELAMNWASCWAIAVNEENASGGRVVTAPTNGAAGIIPSVLRYYLERHVGDMAGVERFLLAAAAVGGLCKRNASISGAEVGCQGEVGSAASMAAAGLAAALGATDAQIENAAEIALEHHLGMTCDPIAGLVQVPCIERNAMGAVKAINACSLAMLGSGVHLVSLDQAIETMRTTGADMQSRYKETSLGGLAVITVRQVEC